MNDLYLHHARQHNENLVNEIYLEKQIMALRPKRLGMRERILMRISDLMLAAGLRIRPKEIKVYNEVNIEGRNNMCADLT